MTTKQQLHEDQIIGVEIDLEELKKNDQLNESFLRMFGSWVTLLLKGMFGIPLVNMNIKGSPGDVKAFAAAIGNEKCQLLFFADLSDPTATVGFG